MVNIKSEFEDFKNISELSVLSLNTIQFFAKVEIEDIYLNHNDF
ncbi:MAG: hypothetical protein ACFFAN_16715 [Promethearchaeota archaeon]